MDLLPAPPRGWSDGSGRRQAWCALAISISSLLAAPVATWWLVGDQSEPGGEDYLWRPPRLSADTVRNAGVLALGVVVLGLFLLARSTSKRRLSWIWWLVEGPLVAAGSVTGYSLRVMTLAAHGANIGGGLLVYALAPFLLLVLTVEAGLSAWLVVSTPKAEEPTTQPAVPS